MLSRREAAKNRLEGPKVGRSLFIANQIRSAELQSLVTAKQADYKAKVADLVRNYRSRADFPDNKGIVMCVGGQRYFTCAYVAVKQLRALGCKLPIEFWHLGNRELDGQMQELVEPLGVVCKNAYTFRGVYPSRILNGWELNPYSIIHSSFGELLFLDADNIPVKDPTYLFDEPEYKEKGAIFWPDYRSLAQTRPIWSVMDVPYRPEPEFESGQIVINKKKSDLALALTMHLNENSDYYYRFVHGDKETYHMAWAYLNQPYAMTKTPIKKLPEIGNSVCMCQHDLQGNRLFQHRNMDKWKLDGTNKSVPGFLFDSECREYIAELRSNWSGIIDEPVQDDQEQLAINEINRTKKFKLHNYTLNYTKTIEFGVDGLVNSELGDCSEWYIQNENSGIGGDYELNLTLRQDHRLKHKLVPADNMRWQGYDAFNFDRVVLCPYNQTL